MGEEFAQNLLSDGYQVIVEDRDAERANALAPRRARVATRLAELAPCDVVITSLPNDEVLASVALLPDGLAAILAPGSIHISMSTCQSRCIWQTCRPPTARVSWRRRYLGTRISPMTDSCS
jgi:3-hydroxyisobutyrate dehydrogenase-like beta-hydroxyacid dehydrogenase